MLKNTQNLSTKTVDKTVDTCDLKV